MGRDGGGDVKERIWSKRIARYGEVVPAPDDLPENH